MIETNDFLAPTFRGSLAQGAFSWTFGIPGLLWEFYLKGRSLAGIPKR